MHNYSINMTRLVCLSRHENVGLYKNVGSMKNSRPMCNHNLYFVLPSSCTLSQLIPGYRIGLGLGLFLVSTDSIVQIFVHVQILHILFFMCPKNVAM